MTPFAFRMCFVSALASSLHCGRAASDGEPSACVLEGCAGTSPDSTGAGSSGGSAGAPASPPENTDAPDRLCETGSAATGLFASSQADLEFLRGCTEIESLAIQVFPDFDPEPLASLRRVTGSLSLLGGSEARVTNPLQFLVSIEDVGSLSLHSLDIDSLLPLAGLAIRDELAIENCRGFGTLEGLGPLEVETLTLRHLPELRSLSGLQGSVSALNVVNTGLSDLKGLELETDALIISQNPELLSLSGLESLSGSLHVEANPKLVELAAPAAGMGELHIANNAALTHLPGLESLREISQLIVRSNTALESLEGLHALERAGHILINGNPALAGLGGLRSLVEVDSLQISGIDPVGLPLEIASATQRIANLAGLDALRRASSLSITRTVGLVTLAGLEQVSVETLSLTSNPDLASLDGFSAEALMEDILISDCPALVDIDALEPLVSIDGIQIDHTGITQVDALRNLRRAGYLLLHDNSALSQLDGLAHLDSSDEVRLASLPALRTLPTFENWVSSGVFYAAQLESLELGPSFPVLVSGGAFIFDKNPALQRLDGFPALERIGMLSVERNQSLTALALPSLVDAESLYVQGNPSLTSESLATLSAVKVSGERTVRGSSLVPCPWNQDGQCDETAGFCAAGSDSDCF